MRLREFVTNPDPWNGGEDDEVPDHLYRLANLWWNSADPQEQQAYARELAALGWTIQQVDYDYVQLKNRAGQEYTISDSGFDPDLDEVVNPNLRPGWERREHRGGLDLLASYNEPNGQRVLSILAYDRGGREIGNAHFEVINDHLESFDTYVRPDMRHQGIATVMYDYAQELGNDLKPSGYQTRAGKRFWRARQQPQQVAEISDELRRSYLDRAGRHVDRRMDHMARVRDKLNKGYEIYHADRPAGSSQIVDRFEADTPAEARRYYEQYIQNYESDRDFDLRLRRATGIMELFDRPVKHEPTTSRTRQRFKTDVDGHEIQVHFNPKGDQLEVDFYVDGRGFAVQNTVKNPREVFSAAVRTIMDRLPEAIAYYKPKTVWYKSVGLDKSRVSLYKKLLDVFQQSLGPDWTAKTFPKEGWQFYTLTRNKLDEIARIPQGDYGDEGTLAGDVPRVKRKPLPGGSGYTYGVNKKDPEYMEIMIFDEDKLVAEMDLSHTRDPLKTWQVENVATDPAYRGQGLGKALYGIALSILKLTVEAGETQTKHGQRMWIMLNSIPGVEVQGYAMEPTAEYRARPGDEVVDQNKTWTRYTFPVEPGQRSMRSTRRGTGIYSSHYVSMIARWTGA